MFMAGFFFWDDLDVQFQLQLNSIAKRKKCHLAKVQFFDWNTFFQKNVKKNFFWRVGGGRKLFFTIFSDKRKQKTQGGKLFSFFEGREGGKKIIFYYFANGATNILP